MWRPPGCYEVRKSSDTLPSRHFAGASSGPSLCEDCALSGTAAGYARVKHPFPEHTISRRPWAIILRPQIHSSLPCCLSSHLLSKEAACAYTLRAVALRTYEVG